MNYLEAWQFLDNLQFFTIKLGLDAVNVFLERLGSPHKKLRYIHVAGTNGKGSVSSTMLSVLSSAGHKVGFYSSPHLSSVRERFRINNSYIDEASFAHLSQKIIDVLQGEQITYFEFTTTLAFLWFAQEDVDIAIMEVGMGGRLDATNVITPLVSIITNISLDHVEHLGTTIKSIATEKAGIIKPGVPVVCGSLESEAAEVVEAACKKTHSKQYCLDHDYSFEKNSDSTLCYSGFSAKIDGLQLRLAGHFQCENAAIALAALEIIQKNGFQIPEESIRTGLSKVQWPGRLEYLEKINQHGMTQRILFDGAHNHAGVTALTETVLTQFAYESLILVWASMSDKDYCVCLALMAPLADTIIFTQPDKNRSATVDQLYACLDGTLDAHVQTFEDVNDAVAAALNIASPDDLICIAGSLYLVGYARKFLCGEIVNE